MWLAVVEWSCYNMVIIIFSLYHNDTMFIEVNHALLNYALQVMNCCFKAFYFVLFLSYILGSTTGRR